MKIDLTSASILSALPGIKHQQYPSASSDRNDDTFVKCRSKDSLLRSREREERKERLGCRSFSKRNLTSVPLFQFFMQSSWWSWNYTTWWWPSVNVHFELISCVPGRSMVTFGSHPYTSFKLGTACLPRASATREEMCWQPLSENIRCKSTLLQNTG